MDPILEYFQYFGLDLSWIEPEEAILPLEFSSHYSETKEMP